jgi:hypothetical protein
MPANLPVGRDLTIRRKIENGRYYCAFAVRKPIIELGHHVALNPRAPEAAAKGQETDAPINCVSALPPHRR